MSTQVCRWETRGALLEREVPKRLDDSAPPEFSDLVKGLNSCQMQNCLPEYLFIQHEHLKCITRYKCYYINDIKKQKKTTLVVTFTLLH